MRHDLYVNNAINIEINGGIVLHKQELIIKIESILYDNDVKYI